MKTKGLLEEKTYIFALHSIIIYKKIIAEKREFILSKQFLRSATSIGANSKEASAAQSKADFICKLSIAHKESLETEYWINLLKDSYFIEDKDADVLLEEVQVIIKIIARSLITAKKT